MSKDFEQIYSVYELREIDKRVIPADQLQKIVISELSHHLANFIMHNIGQLPIEVRETIMEQTGNTEYRAGINIISDDEVRRLRQIEMDYFKILDFANRKEL